MAEVDESVAASPYLIAVKPPLDDIEVIPPLVRKKSLKLKSNGDGMSETEGENVKWRKKLSLAIFSALFFEYDEEELILQALLDLNDHNNLLRRFPIKFFLIWTDA